MKYKRKRSASGEEVKVIPADKSPEDVENMNVVKVSYLRTQRS